MRLSRMFVPTLRTDPADAEVVSHRLLTRAGYIRRVTSGVYDFLPLGLMVLRNIEAVVREEMNAAGAQELLMPMVQPAELWRESGRWDKYGKELLRFTDRHGHESCLGPTHEEVICDLIRRELRSYRQLPLNLYQIQAKFRDEIRPRFGLMRGREFIMKDAYSFHADDDDLAREYDNMFATYGRIFSRLGLEFRAVQADTGAIGGSRSHEFHVLAEAGEDVLATCTACDYAANVEMAKGKRPRPDGQVEKLHEVATPGLTAAEEVAAFLGVAPSLLVKTIVYRIHRDAGDETVAVCVRGDDTVQDVKLAHVLGADTVALATDEQIAAIGGVTGFVGPQGLRCRILMDDSLKHGQGLVAGANRQDHHVIGLDVTRDVTQVEFVDIRSVREGDRCLDCGGLLSLSRGIEVGHVFALGRRYTEPMGVTFQDQAGKLAVATMGCYGIGVSRLLAAVVEQCHDETGIRWPIHLAPFHVALISIGESSAVLQTAEQLYAQLKNGGVRVLWDERKERPGVKFRDAELLGLPLLLVVGERGLARGVVECAGLDEKVELPVAEIPSHVQRRLAGHAA